MGIAERVSGIIDELGLTPSDFAQRAGLDDQRLIDQLAGHRRFTSLDLAIIADVYEVTVDWLLTGKDPWSGIHVRVCRMPSYV